MDEPAQGIVDRPVTSDEMAAVDQSASQYGAVVQPTSAMPVANEPGVIPVPASDNPTDVTMPAPEAVIPTPVLDETPVASADVAFVEPPAPTLAQLEQASAEITPEANNQVLQQINQVQTSADVAQTLGVAPIAATGQGNDEELLSVKQQSLEQLTPIVDTLQLPAEERFDILMMIIRASDDKKLIKPAFDAANGITDNDKRARALLDVVNEVNYLTQNKPDQPAV